VSLTLFPVQNSVGPPGVMVGVGGVSGLGCGGSSFRLGLFFVFFIFICGGFREMIWRIKKSFIRLWIIDFHLIQYCPC